MKWIKFNLDKTYTWPNYSDYDEFPYCLVTDADIEERLYVAFARFDRYKKKWLELDGRDFEGDNLKDVFANVGPGKKVTHYMDLSHFVGNLEHPKGDE